MTDKAGLTNLAAKLTETFFKMELELQKPKVIKRYSNSATIETTTNPALPPVTLKLKRAPRRLITDFCQVIGKKLDVYFRSYLPQL